jgi:hypothetical protein
MTIQKYAIVNSGIVVNVIHWDGVTLWTPPAGCTAIQNNIAGIGWTYASGVFTPPFVPTPILTPQQKSQMALNAPINLISTSTPALNGSYSVNSSAIANLNAVTTYILVNSAFPGSLSEMPWVDTTGAMHEFPNTALFTQFASAVADYVSQVTLYGDSNGTYGSLPSPNITIS